MGRFVLISLLVAIIGGAGMLYLRLPDGDAASGEPAAPAVAPPAAMASAPDDAAAPAPRRKAYPEDDFAELNKRRQGVVTLPSGVQYEVLEEGQGDVPEPEDAVLIRYAASLADGRVFDDRMDDEPRVLELAEIKSAGLREALLLMPTGSRWRVVVPPDQGAGYRGAKMLRNRVIIWDVRLVGVESRG